MANHKGMRSLALYLKLDSFAVTRPFDDHFVSFLAKEMGKPKPKTSVAAKSKGPSATTRKQPASTRNLAKSLVSKPSPKVASSARSTAARRQSTSTNLKAAAKIGLF